MDDLIEKLVAEVDEWLALIPSRSLFSADDVANHLLDIRNAAYAIRDAQRQEDLVAT